MDETIGKLRRLRLPLPPVATRRMLARNMVSALGATPKPCLSVLQVSGGTWTNEFVHATLTCQFLSNLPVHRADTAAGQGENQLGCILHVDALVVAAAGGYVPDLADPLCTVGPASREKE